MLGLLGGFAAGCGASSAPASRTTSTESTTTVTANRPVTAEHKVVKTDPVDRTNTGVNARDRGTTAKTPFDQSENKTDIKITADIRKRVVDSKMSSEAHNVKIITQDGKVTLRGPVTTEDEKQTIEKIAENVAGADNIDSQLEVNVK